MSVKYVEETSSLYIKDAVLYWASVRTPKLKFGSTTDKEFQVTAVISAEDVKALKKIGLNKSYKEVGSDVSEEHYPGLEGKYVVKFTQAEMSKAGKKLQVACKTSDGADLTADIGNGSKGHIKLYVVQGTGATKGKLNSRLNAVVVTELVEYAGKSNVDDELGIDLRTTSSDVPFDDDINFD